MRAMPITSPFLLVPGLQQGVGGRLHGDVAGGYRHAPGFCLVAYVNHMRLAAGVKVGKGGHDARLVKMVWQAQYLQWRRATIG